MWILRSLVGNFVRKQRRNIVNKARDQVLSSIQSDNLPRLVQQHGQAAEEGDPHAQYLVGCAFFSGRGAPQDFAEAAKWFWASANQGHPAAQCNLGVLYHGGMGIESNLSEAFRWFSYAANQGSIPGVYSLATCYMYGEGTAANPTEAARLFRSAADQGYAPAQRNLGLMIEYGHLPASEYSEAFVWYSLAANRGDKEATRLAKRLSNNLDQRTLSEAQENATQMERQIQKNRSHQYHSE